MHIVIVGAGIIGLATAFELRTRGARVTLLDPAPGQGASHAAAGMLAPAAETTWGHHGLHHLLATSAAAYPRFVKLLEEASGSAPNYVQNSTLVVAAEPADRDALLELVSLQESLGLSAQKLLGSAARRLEPALATNIAGAVLCAEDHQIDPRSVVRLLLTEFEDSLIREQGISLIQRSGKTLGVRTERGQEILADQVLLASGLGKIQGLPELPLRPVHGDILRIQGSISQPLIHHTIRGVVHRQPVYLVPRTDGSLVLGASSREDDNPGVNLGEMHTLLDNARRLVPGIADTTLNEVIARARPGTPDDIPLIGRVDDGLVVSTGYSRHGVLLTPLGARLGADLVLGTSTNERLTDIVDIHRFSRSHTGHSIFQES